VSTALSIGSILAALYLGLAAGLNRARRSWTRAYERGLQDAEAIWAPALEACERHAIRAIREAHGAEVPESAEVLAEDERRQS
jgi:hypothetical protein